MAHKKKKSLKKITVAMKRKKKPMKRFQRKIEIVMEEFKDGNLRSGSKKGPRVTNRKQAIAIALSEARALKKKKPVKKRKK